LVQVWCYIAIIIALGRLREEGNKFEASLGCIVRPCLKKRVKNQKKKKRKRNRPLCTYIGLGAYLKWKSTLALQVKALSTAKREENMYI
jgi:hypothetical protein